MEPPGTICNLCKGPLVKLWYRCLRCLYIELCVKCKETKRNVGPHYFNHPVQCVLSTAEQRLCYEGELRVGASPSSPYPRGYTCPYCGKLGFSIMTLYQHLHERHLQSITNKVKVNCPICYAEPGAHTFVITNLIYHMDDLHIPGNSGTTSSETMSTSST